MMKRRSFLGLLGGAAASGPKVAAESMRDLEIPGVAFSDENNGIPAVLHSPQEKSWARKQLKKLVSRTDEERERKRRRTTVYNLDPDIHALRSVSIGRKMAMQRDINFRKEEEREREYLNDIIRGFFD